MDLTNILKLHALWLASDPSGRRAILTGATLTGAYLTGTNLTGAYLTDADLTDADLTDANLTGTNLTGTNLTGADLTDADLTDADLTDADLTDANLTDANLTRAILTDATLTRANLPDFQLSDGDMTGWKKLQLGHICELRIPAAAKRTASLVGNKCRAEYAVVVAGSGRSLYDGSFTYAVGETVRPDHYNDDPRIECAGGIHFFRTRKEAEAYS